MNRLERYPHEQIVGADQDRPDRGKRDRYFELDAGTDAAVGADLDPTLEAARDLAHHFQADSAAGHLVERGAGGHSRAENEFEYLRGRERRGACGRNNFAFDGCAEYGVDIDSRTVVGAG